LLAILDLDLQKPSVQWTTSLSREAAVVVTIMPVVAVLVDF
jgi:hypothetical protein